MLTWRIPNHKLYDDVRSYEMLSVDRDKLFTSLEIDDTTTTFDGSKTTVNVWIHAYKKLNLYRTFNYKFEFEGNQTKSEKLLDLLSAMCCLYPGIWLDTREGIKLDYANLLVDDNRKSERSAMLAFMRDYIWQAKVTNFWKPAMQDIKATEPSDALLDRLFLLPECPYPEFGYHSSDYIKANLVGTPDPEKTVVSMSFGKESLFTYGLMKELYGADRLALGTINYTGTEAAGLEKLKGFSDAYLRELNRMQFYGDAPKDVRVAKTNLFAVNNKNPFEIFVYHPQLFALMHHINFPERPVVIFGDEFEITIEEKIELDGVNYPVFTFEYQQSTYMHAKWNYLMKSLALPFRVTSKIYHLMEIQCQALGPKVLKHFTDYQTSCWFSNSEHKWCGKCNKCRRLTFMMQSLGQVKPKELQKIGISGLSGVELLELDAINEPYLAEISEENLRASENAWRVRDPQVNRTLMSVRELLKHGRLDKLEYVGMKSRLLADLIPEDSRHPRYNDHGEDLGLSADEEVFVYQYLQQIFS
jgi:hypothetical protein